MIRIITPSTDVNKRYLSKSIRPSGTKIPVDISINRLVNDPLIESTDVSKKLRRLIKLIIRLKGISLDGTLAVGLGKTIPVISDRLSPYYHDPNLLIVKDGRLSILLPLDTDSKMEVVANHITRAVIRLMTDVDVVIPQDLISFVEGFVGGSKLVKLESKESIILTDNQVIDIAEDLSSNQVLHVDSINEIPNEDEVERFMIQHNMVTTSQLNEILYKEHRIRTMQLLLDEAPSILIAAACILITMDSTSGISCIIKSTGYIYIASLGYDMLCRDFAVFTQSSHRWMASTLISTGILALNRGSITAGMLMIVVGLITMSLFEKQINAIFDTLSDQLMRLIPWKKNK